MRTIAISFGLLMLTLLGIGCETMGGTTQVKPEPPPGAQMGELSAADISSIQTLDSTYNSSLRTGDLEKAVNAIYAEDVVMIPPNGKPFKGRGAQLAHLRSLDARDWEHRPGAIVGRGGMAYELSEWTLAAKVNGVPTKISGARVDLLRKQPDGQWLIVAEMWSEIPSGELPGLTSLIAGASVGR